MANVVGSSFGLIGLGFWSPAAASVSALSAPRALAAAASLPTAELLGVRARGRASMLTLMFAEVVEQAVAAAHRDIRSFASIYGSALGEMQRLMQLLQTLQSPSKEISPLRFQTSVHNAASGQISIEVKNPCFSTSLAAGKQTVAMSFVEAAAWMQTYQAPLLLVMGDEAPPEQLSGGTTAYSPIAAALALVPADDAEAHKVPQLRLVANLNGSGDDYGSGCWEGGANPCAVLEPLVAWLYGGGEGIFSLNGPRDPRYGIERL